MRDDIFRHNPDLTYSNFIFVTSAKNLIQGFFSWLGGYISLKLGVKPTIVLGCLTLMSVSGKITSQH